MQELINRINELCKRNSIEVITNPMNQDYSELRYLINVLAEEHYIYMNYYLDNALRIHRYDMEEY